MYAYEIQFFLFFICRHLERRLVWSMHVLHSQHGSWLSTRWWQCWILGYHLLEKMVC